MYGMPRRQWQASWWVGTPTFNAMGYPNGEDGVALHAMCWFQWLGLRASLSRGWLILLRFDEAGWFHFVLTRQHCRHRFDEAVFPASFI